MHIVSTKSAMVACAQLLKQHHQQSKVKKSSLNNITGVFDALVVDVWLLWCSDIGIEAD